MKTLKKSQKQDIASSMHGMYIAMQNAGVLVNGHMTKQGFRESDQKKEISRKACRKPFLRKDLS